MINNLNNYKLFNFFIFMAGLSSNEIKKIRTKPWYINKQNLILDKEVVEEIVKNLKLTKCPVCKEELESRVSDYIKPRELDEIKKYCPKNDYMITLRAVRYNDPEEDITCIYLGVSQKGRLIAFSGQL